MSQHPVFISYNRQDAALVRPLVEALRARGLNPWFDQDQLPPGQPWRKAVEAGLEASAAVAVCIGPGGLGPIHEEEMDVALDLARREGKSVIPVLLRDAAPLPLFLTRYGYADLSDGPDGPGLDKLIQGIGARSDKPAVALPPPLPAPLEFTLRVRADGEALSAAWSLTDHSSGHPGNDDLGEFPLSLPLGKADLDELAWYLERYLEFPGAGDRAHAQGVEARLTQWGKALFEALFPNPAVNALYQRIRDHLDDQGRVLLSLVSDHPGFLIRPWEMLRDSRGPLALRGLTLRRRPAATDPRRAGFELDQPLRLLLIVARPEDTGFIDPRTSTRPVLEALAPLGEAVRVDFCEPPTLPELQRRLAAARRARQPYHVVHFDGHGQYYPETGVGALCFENDARNTELVEGRHLGDLLSRQQVPVVLLEACRGSQLSNKPIFGAVAPALLQSGVGSVIAFSHSVHVAAATLLSERLYQGLVAGLSVGEALEEARAALHADRARWLVPGPDPDTVDLQDWIIPQLYQGGADPVLVPGGAPAGERPQEPAQQPAQALPGFPPAPRYRFQGRARELLRLERALRDHPAALLHAGGGMGKTALAREAAHWWRRTGRFDTALFQSFEQGAGAEAVVQLLGANLGDEQDREAFARLGAEEQWARAVALFRSQPVLLVWDNYESVLPAFHTGSGAEAEAGAEAGGNDAPVEDSLSSALDAPARADLERLYRDLTAEDPSDTQTQGRLLVTCRPAATGLDGIQEVPLQGLARPDALHLLASAMDRKAIDRERPGYEREALEALLERLADHPLSIELVAPHLAELTPKTIVDELSARLHQFQDHTHLEGRNRSLLASLDFSRDRLSPEARAALPWLGWFEGGMFEASFLAFSEIPESDWGPIRDQLQATALLRVETLPQFSSPYLKLHPTLAEAARPGQGQSHSDGEGDGEGDGDDVGDIGGQRFIGVYLQVMQMIDQALRGSQPAAGMALMARELANLRRAMAQAFARGAHREGGALADILGTYLARAGRLRERDRLTAWVRDHMPEDRLDEAACRAILQHAWTLFTQGKADEALAAVRGLARRLEGGELVEGDLALEQAQTHRYEGRILLNAGRPDLALPPLERAIAGFRALGEDQRGNLSAALGDQANALMALGRYDPALAVADEGLALNRALGHDREVATALGQTAAILSAAGRHGEAEARFREGIAAAEQVGDQKLQGAFQLHLGEQQRETGRIAESITTLKRALALFQRAGDAGGEMQTCDLLGTSEAERGQLDPAEAWYRKALGLAQERQDLQQIAGTRQNLGILHQTRAQALDDPAAREPQLRAALAEVEASLDIKQRMGNRLGAAASHSQLGRIHRLLGDLDQAERAAHQALTIREALNHPDQWKDYANLADIARDRGDTHAAEEWQAKADAKLEELERLAAGPEGGAGRGDRGGNDDRGTPDLDDQLIQALLQVAQGVYQARARDQAPAADLAEALAQISGLPEPLGAFGRYLSAIAAGDDPPPPPGLPGPLQEIAEGLQAALRET